MIKEKQKKKEIGIVTRPDILENQVKKNIFLAIGSNLGNKKHNIETAKTLLQLNGVFISRCSSYYITPSWPDPKKPEFLNIVVNVETKLLVENLLNLCNLIEKHLGRKRVVKNEPRTCDIDIIDYNKLIINTANSSNLVLPHPKVSSRNFVLLPLFEISKNWIHPKSKINIAKLINLLKEKDLTSIKKI